jgi:large subunit ribosomal protein L5
VGLGDAPDNVGRLEAVQDQLERITGQTPVVTRARKSVAGFGIRRGDPAGVKVTLRRDKMHNFLQKLIHLALPRTRDFSGLDPTSIDQAGNYSLGIDGQVIFPEIGFEDAEDTTRFGMDVTLVTSTHAPEEALVLLTEYGLPFKDV